MKTIATLGEDGVMDLSAEPESAYAEARKNKDLAHAIQALVEMRDDWHCWMTKGLKGLNPEQDVYVLATIVYLAGVRQAVPQILVVRGVYREALAGEEWIGHFSVPEMALHRCLDAVEKRVLALRSGFLAGLDGISQVVLLSPRDPALATGLVTARVQGWPCDSLSQHLWESHGIVCNVIREWDAVRFSLAFFTSEQELTATLQALDDAAGGRISGLG